MSTSEAVTLIATPRIEKPFEANLFRYLLKQGADGLLIRNAGGLYAWARSSKGDKDGNKLVAVEKGAITEKAIAVGQIQPRQKFQVKSKISGIIKRCMVNVAALSGASGVACAAAIRSL